MKLIAANRVFWLGSLSLGLLACGGPTGETGSETTTEMQSSGKHIVDPASLPDEALDAAMAMRPGMMILGVEHEVRDGKDYYDVEGELDGTEIELNITRIEERWTVVEMRRDIPAAEAPAAVSAALSRAQPGLKIARVRENDQGSSIIIYEFFGAGADGQDTRVEVRYDGTLAAVLTSERAP
jgi:hypothetical protein